MEVFKIRLKLQEWDIHDSTHTTGTHQIGLLTQSHCMLILHLTMMPDLH